MIQYRMFKERFVCWYKQLVVIWHLNRSTFRARNLLKNSGPIMVLIDNSVLGYGRTHESVFLKEKINWITGEDTCIDVLHRAPIDIKQKYGETVFENVQYLPGIVHLAQLGLLELKTSFELFSERNHHPTYRFLGRKGYFDYNLFEKIIKQIKSVDGYDLPDFSDWFARNPTTINKVFYSTDIDPLGLYPDNDKRQRKRIAESNDSLYKGLVSLFLGDKYIKDAWHIRTAEVNNLFCFLTMDFRLRKNVEENRNKEPISSLRTKVMTPKEFGENIGVSAINPYLCEWAEKDSLQSSARLRKKLRRMRNEK